MSAVQYISAPSVPAPRVLFAGGGTGGHLFPALALARALEAAAPGCALRFLGSERPIERTILAPSGYAHEALPAAAWPGLRGLLRRGPGFLVTQLRALRAARRALRAFQPDLVVGLGGFPSVAPCLAARLQGVPVVLFEPNATPGKANALLARIAREALVQWEETALPCARARVGVPIALGSRTGEPLPTRAAAARARLGLPPAQPALLIMGGSQGARALNAWITAALRELPGPPAVSIIHLAGSEAAADALRAEYAAAGIAHHVRAFLHEMALAYRAADLALVRGGAATLAELLAMELPGVVVPMPASAGDHQRFNARAFAATGAGEWLEQEGLDGAAFARLLALTRDATTLAARRARARAAARPQAAHQAARRLLALIAAASKNPTASGRM